MKAKRSTRSAIVDHLTGLYNRRHFDWCLKKSISEAKRKKDHFSLLMIDIDKFKDVNDKHGHLSGDKTLNDLAKILKKSVRRVDICFRYGGDEIAVILPDAEKEAAEHIAARLKSKVEKHRFAIEDGHRLSLKLSIGLAIFPDDGQKPKVLIKRADELLYKVKRQKKSTKRKITESFILETKLIPPVLKEKTIIRPRLVSLLKENLNKKLILITANAGYGKTTLLAQLCAEFDKPYMFYDLDGSDNDLATFFNYIVTGIQRHYIDFGERTKGILGQTRNIEILVGTFINEFVEHSRKNPPIPPLLKGGKGGLSSSFIKNLPKKQEEISPHFYIILDDYHHLQQNKKITNTLDYLLHHLPINLHIIVSSRSIPPLNLAYYFAKQELFKLEKAHLQFNLKEIQLLLKEGYGLNIPKEEIERIEKHSEGWITAIQLILQKISASGEQKAKETLNGYIASGEEVFNYFANEVFESQPEEIREFLIKTSILEYLNPKICNYVLNIKTSQNILSYLETAHIFVSRGKDNFKYHLLFQEFLFKRLKIFYTGDRIRLLYRKAGQYFSKAKDYFNTVNYYLLSEDYEKAAKNLEVGHSILSLSSKSHTFLSLVDRLPRVILDKHPYLLFEKSRIFSFLGKWDEALKILSKIKRIFKKQSNNKGFVATLDQIGFVYLLLMKPRKALLFEKKAHKLVGRRNQMLKAKILANLGNINRALGRYDEAEIHLKEALSISVRINNTEIEIYSLEGLARLYCEKTDFNTAEEVYSTLFAKYDDKNLRLSFASLCANAAVLHIELFNFAKSEELINQAVKFAKLFNDRRTIMYTSGIYGKFYLYQRNYRKVIEYDERALKLNLEFKEKLVELYAHIDIAYSYVMMNEINRAKRELKKIEDLISPQLPPPILTYLFLVESKIAMAEKNIKSAEKKLYQALEIAEKYQLSYREMATLYHLSQIYFECDDEKRSKNCLGKCLNIAEKRGYDFFVINEAKENLKIFEYALNKGINKHYVLTILETINTPDAQRLCSRIGLEKLKYDFEINLFGNLTIKDIKGKILNPEWKTHKAKSLFIYLTINQGKQILKDHLIETFWSDKRPCEAAHSLHDQISFVRRVLKEILGKTYSAKGLIKYRSQFYILNNSLHLKVDTREFDELVKKAAAVESINKSKAITLYKMALDIYKGDFCPEIYEQWADEQRKYYRTEALRLTKNLADIYFVDKDYHKSLDLYRRALQYDQCDETIHLGIIRCFYALNDKTRVCRQYQTLEKILKTNMRTSPSPETIRVYQEILHNFI